LFVSNKAATGGGQGNSGAATVWGSDVDFFNCTFVDNSASYGTVLTVGGGKASMENCILWENNDNPIALVDAGQNGSELTVSYCDVENGQNSVTVGALSTLYWNSNNMDTDPLFAGVGDHPYALDPNSPCIDAGNPDAEDLPDVLQDFLGNDRIWDGDNDESAVVDMGPYEYGSLLIASVFEHADFHVSAVNVRVYPNPFTTSTTLEYLLVRPTRIILNIFDERGRPVLTIQEQQPVGQQQIILYPGCLATGIYYFRLQADDRFYSGKIILSE
jgi:hypothetical protein